MKKQTNKTAIINMRSTEEIKGMAKDKSKKAGYRTVTEWLTAYIKRAR
jgi:hypothetical protein